MAAGARIAIDETQVAVESPLPSRLRSVAFVECVNNAATAVYLNMWSGTTLSRAAADRVGGPWRIPIGSASPVLTDARANEGAVFSVTTGTDATGAPSAAADIVPHWEP
jgi:hypothetical protein